jgi:hypothetical protein
MSSSLFPLMSCRVVRLSALDRRSHKKETLQQTIHRKPKRHKGAGSVPGFNKSLYYHTAFRSSKPRSRGKLSGCHLPPGPPFPAQHPQPHTPFLSSSKLTPRFELETCLRTTLKSDSSHGSSSGPTLLNPYSSSAKWRSCLKAGWLRYAVRTINRCELTDTATCPAGTSEQCPAEAAARALQRRSIWRRRTMQRILLLHFDPIFRFWF